MHPSAGDPTSAGPVGPATVYAAVLTVVTLFLQFNLRGNRIPLARLAWDWSLWMPVVAGIGMLAIVLRRGGPKGIRDTVRFVALNLLLLSMAWLSWTRELIPICLPLFNLAGRLAIATCWIGAALGLLAFPLWLRRRDRSAAPPAWIKWWFAATLFVLLAEAGTRTLDHPASPRVHAPNWPRRAESDREFRIAALGGSTMLGFPYEPKVDIPKVCAARLAAMYPERTFTVENVAVGGLNLRGAIQELRGVKTRPDLIILYTGHNEAFYDIESDLLRAKVEYPLVDGWFGWSSAYRAVSGFSPGLDDLSQGRLGRTVFDAPVFPESMAEERLARFRQTLVDFAVDCRRQNIAMIWFVPAAGEGTFEPNRSYIEGRISSAQQESILSTLSDARRLEGSGRWNEAEAAYRGLLARHPEFAEFHFRLAEALVAQGRIAEAKSSFRAAIDCDGFPCQAPTEYRQCIVDVAEQEQILLIDAESVLVPLTENGLLDRTVFHDNVHPTLAGYLALGSAAAERAFAESLVEQGIETAAAELVPLDDSAIVADAGFDADDLATAYERIAFALERLAMRRYDTTRRHAEAARYRLWAGQLRNGEIQPGEQGTESLTQFRPGGVRMPSLERVGDNDVPGSPVDD